MWILEWTGRILMAGAFGAVMWLVLYNFLAKPFAKWITWRHEVERPLREAKAAEAKAKKDAKIAERKRVDDAKIAFKEALKKAKMPTP